MQLKAIAIGFVFLVILHFAAAQTIIIEKTYQGDKLTFSVLKEINISKYVIEGAGDSLNFVIIGVVKAKGESINTVKYEFINYTHSYHHYRIKQIDMSGSCVAQMRITNAENILNPVPH